MKGGDRMERNNVLMVVLVAVVGILLISFVSETVTGYGIKDWLRGKGGKGKCTSNGFECGDCIDNDGDELIDYKINKKGKVTGDPDCSSRTDNTEASCFPACNSNPDCGTNGYVGDPYCGVDGNSYRNYLVYTCYNPGECTAMCGNQTDSYIWQICGTGNQTGTCYNGVCGGSGNSTA